MLESIYREIGVYGQDHPCSTTPSLDLSYANEREQHPTGEHKIDFVASIFGVRTVPTSFA